MYIFQIKYTKMIMELYVRFIADNDGDCNSINTIMNITKYIFMTAILLFTLVNGKIAAQSVSFDMPKNAGIKTIVFLKYGIKNDTIFSGTPDKKGQLTIRLPKDYKGIAAIVTERVGAYYEFAVAGEDMTLHCNNEYLYTGVVTFENSPENDSLNAWFSKQAMRQRKIALTSEMLKIYGKDNALYPLLEKELAVSETEQSVFEKELSESKMYAARFIELRNFLNKNVMSLLHADSAQMASTRAYVRDTLDVNVLYTSGMWFDVLNGLLDLYNTNTPYHDAYIDDMSLLLERAVSEQTYATLAENLFAICESMGWQNLEEQLAYRLINGRHIDNPPGQLKNLMTLFKLMKGSNAPALSYTDVLQTSGETTDFRTPTILVFYETGCNNCDNEMLQLRGNYAVLKKKGYEVVSVSADTEQSIFENTSTLFPWEKKLCDLKGFRGENFKNYGVIGAPTFYVIDKNGIIQGRYARLEDTGLVD